MSEVTDVRLVWSILFIILVKLKKETMVWSSWIICKSIDALIDVIKYLTVCLVSTFKNI